MRVSASWLRLADRGRIIHGTTWRIFAEPETPLTVLEGEVPPPELVPRPVAVTVSVEEAVGISVTT
jgi:hypothetical protein